MYVYISDQEEFTDFKNEDALFWLKTGLVYGDWTEGPNGDGSFEKTGQIQASEVRFFKTLLSESSFCTEFSGR